MRKFFLASNSPRRKELLKKHHFEFDTFPVKVSEFLDKNLKLDEAVKNIARQKSIEASRLLKGMNLHDNLILSSDTVVVLERDILGKPKDFQEACNFLRRLSSKRHEVKTAVCFLDTADNKEVCEIESSFVTFRSLTENEILNYVSSGSPMDKAGAYGIQDEGGTFISKLEGELDNVMGLPMRRVLRIMKENNWP